MECMRTSENKTQHIKMNTTISDDYQRIAKLAAACWENYPSFRCAIRFFWTVNPVLTGH